MSPELDDKFKVQKLDSVGAADAENDSFLDECFLDTGLLPAILDCRDPRRVLLGRTGSGKSAILRHICTTRERAISLEPKKLALSYITNSTILRFLDQLGIHLDLFFKLLWRHVLTVEILRVRFDIDSERAVVVFFEKILNTAKARKRERALKYLKEWGPSFWEESDYRIKEISSKLESSVESGIGKEPLKLAVSGALSVEEKADVTQRAQQIVNQVQIRELGEILEVLDGILDDSQKPYYVTIDGLDEGWVADAVRFRLVRSLIETCRDFGEVKNAKVVLAMREDLLRRVLHETQEPGFQREKYESLMLRVRWSKTDLETMLDRRVKTLVSRRYTKKPVGLRDIAKEHIDKNTDSVSYILARTLMRPRDAILFLNDALTAAEGQAYLTRRAITGAEAAYSRRRIDSLVDEWSGLWPSLPKLISALPRQSKVIRSAFLDKDFCEDLWQTVFVDLGVRPVLPTDELAVALDRMSRAELDWTDVRRIVVKVLFECGLCAVKVAKIGPLYSYDQPLPTIGPEEMAGVVLHLDRTFWGYFDVAP